MPGAQSPLRDRVLSEAPVGTCAMHPSQLSETDLLAQCTVRRDRRSGPGGQHRNKVETAVVITHDPTQIRAEASERRSQADNRRNAIFRLRLSLALHYRGKVEPTQVPTALWESRRVGERITISASHQDFPAIIAELLDYLEVTGFQLARAAEHFRASSSQLTRLLRSHPPALALVNERRVALGAGRLS
jgi:hypothetical protein